MFQPIANVRSNQMDATYKVGSISEKDWNVKEKLNRGVHRKHGDAEHNHPAHARSGDDGELSTINC